MQDFGKIEKSQKKKKYISREDIVNQAINYHLKGNIEEASKYYQYCINQGFIDQRIFSNYGVILKNNGNLKEAEVFTRKAIKINPSLAKNHSNLGIILRGLGKLNSEDNNIWQKKLFSESILKNKSDKDKVDIYFARANILHRRKNYKESSKFITLANKIKRKLHASEIDYVIKKSKQLFRKNAN